jgi:hypothetical protein
MGYVIVKERVTNKELSRKVKGRGRGPKDAVREGDDWVVYCDSGSTEQDSAVQEAEENASEPSREAKDENKPSEVAEATQIEPEPVVSVPEPYVETTVGETEHVRRTKVEKSDVRMPLAKILEMCQDFPEHRITSEDGEIVTMQCVFVSGHAAEWESLMSNSVYRKVVFDKKADCIEVWVLVPDGPPNYRITEVFEA